MSQYQQQKCRKDLMRLQEPYNATLQNFRKWEFLNVNEVSFKGKWM